MIGALATGAWNRSSVFIPERCGGKATGGGIVNKWIGQGY